MTSHDVVLLDLNYTFVENTRDAHQLPGRYNVSRELYRQWMIPFLKLRNVVLITVRPLRLREETLARIAKLCGGWQPQLACFNEWRVAAPVSKERCLLRDVFPLFGSPNVTSYAALESNVRTRKMYAAHSISARTWEHLAQELAPDGFEESLRKSHANQC